MSKQQADTVSRHPMHDSYWDQESSDDDWPGDESGVEIARDVDLWDAFEIDDEEPQPEYGDFWYEMDSGG